MRLFRKQTPFEKDSKKYIEDKFSFLIERGYDCKYCNRGGEEEFIFVRGTAHIEVYSNNYPFARFGFDVVISDDGYRSDKRKNIIDFLSLDAKQIKSLSPIETVNLYAEAVKKNIDKIEECIL